MLHTRLTTISVILVCVAVLTVAGCDTLSFPILGGLPGDGGGGAAGGAGDSGADGGDGDQDGADGGGGDGQAQPSGASAFFDEVWQTFDQNYSYFIYKEIDWDDVKARYRADFEQDLSDDAFVDKLVEVLGELHDFHIDVQKTDGTWVGTHTREVQENYPHTPRNSYLAGGASYQTLGNDVVRHAWYQDDIAYIRIDTFETGAFQAISDQDIEDIFTTYAAADGVILDIRPNSGGNEDNAAKFTSRFTDAAVLYGMTETRNGPNHDDFDELQFKWLDPSAGTRFEKPVMCLIGDRCMSSAEWCTLMMRACPNATLIGDTTRGASGFPREFELTNGVKYTAPRWVAYTDEYIEIEDRGIAPDIEITTENSFDGSHDYVIERAIQELTS